MACAQIIDKKPGDMAWPASYAAPSAHFHIATNDPAELAGVCRLWLHHGTLTPIRASYLHRDLIDMIETHGRDQYLALRLFGTATPQWPLCPSRLTELALQGAARLWPQRTPSRIQRFRNWFAHHLTLTVASDQAPALRDWLEAHLPSPSGAYFECRDEEAATLRDYGRTAEGMGPSYCRSHPAQVCDVVTLTIDLPPAAADWRRLLPGGALPTSLANKLSHRLCYGDLARGRLDQQCLVWRGYDPCQIAHDLRGWYTAARA